YSLTGYSGSTYIILILLALVPQLIGHSSINLAVRALPVIIVSVAILGEPVGATILGIAILDEVPAVNEIIGGIIVILGIIYVIIKNNFITSISLRDK
ncbi:MAG: EamA family transporter, partial [Chloroflexi bacterium]|nr:EamA family transporter [Chloroflexota bacterium]